MSKDLKYLSHIWTHHEKYIQMSTNMPGIGLVIRKIAIEMLTTLRNQKQFCMVQLMTAS